MAAMDIAIDIGTSYTSIFLLGSGIVLREPSAIAYYTSGSNSKRVCAVGKEALRMVGKTPNAKAKVVSPVKNGIVVDPDACSAMLTEFINKIMPESYILRPKIRAIVGVPIGVTVEDRRNYEDCVLNAGVKNVDLVDSIMLAAIGADLPVSQSFGGVIVSMGGGCTQFAVISLCAIKQARAMVVGGQLMDSAISDAMFGRNNIRLNLSTARKAKEAIATLYPNDTAKIRVGGIDLTTNRIRECEIKGEHIYCAIKRYYDQMSIFINDEIKKLSPAIATEINDKGVNLVGGCATIPGAKAKFKNDLNLDVFINKDAEYATILGGGRLLSDEALCERILALS